MSDSSTVEQPEGSDLVKVARVQNQPEAEFIQNLLLGEGVPSVVRRAPGFDVADFLAAGPRDVLVSAAAEQVAREVLLQTGPDDVSSRAKRGWLRVRSSQPLRDG
jgi:hypothetical protein